MSESYDFSKVAKNLLFIFLIIFPSFSIAEEYGIIRDEVSYIGEVSSGYFWDAKETQLIGNEIFQIDYTSRGITNGDDMIKEACLCAIRACEIAYLSDYEFDRIMFRFIISEIASTPSIVLIVKKAAIHDIYFSVVYEKTAFDYNYFFSFCKGGSIRTELQMCSYDLRFPFK